MMTVEIVKRMKVKKIDLDKADVVNAAFYPNVTTLRSGLCYRKSVCRLSVSLSVTLVHYSGGLTFRQYFFTPVYDGHPLTSV